MRLGVTNEEIARITSASFIYLALTFANLKLYPLRPWCFVDKGLSQIE